MTAKIIDGRRLAGTMRVALGERVDHLQKQGVYPSLVVILIGDDPALLIVVEKCPVIFTEK